MILKDKMKIKIPWFVSFLCTYGAIALVMGTMGSAKAQNNTVTSINQSLNGWFSPRASEKFFEEGRLNIETEIIILTNPERYQVEEILLNNTIEEFEKTNPILIIPEDNLQE